MSRIGFQPKISKSKFIAGCQCLKRLYLQYYQLAPVKVDEAQQAVFDQGHEVGNLATQAFPGGVLVEADYLHHQEAMARTQDLMSNKTVPAIFEAAFMFDNTRIRVDILERQPRNRWRLIEVKASNDVKDYHYLDVALQKYVLKGCGLKLSEACLMYLNKNYVFDGRNLDLKELFLIDDLTDDLSGVVTGISDQLAREKEILSLDAPPEIEPGPQCKDPYQCEFFDMCNEAVPKYWVGSLPRLSKQKRQELSDQGIELIHDIPKDFSLSDLQRRICLCVQKGKPYFGKEISKELNKLKYPLYFMDFETYYPAIPRYVGMRPFNQIPFQWSVHVQKKPGNAPEHHEFLADDANDPREAFIRRLLKVLETNGGKGNIISYSAGFETTRLNELATWLPQYASRIEKVKGRLWDLHPFIKAYVYHPEFYGSFSLKKVLPVLVPHMTYEGMEIAEGNQPGLAYNALVRGSLSDERERLRDALLKYCKQDTLAMVELIKMLRKRVNR